MPPVVIGAGIAAAGAIGGGVLAASGQKKAAKTAANAATTTADANNALQRETRDQNIALATPYRTQGLAAGNALNGLLLGGDAAPGALNAWDQFRQGSNYDWRLSEGQKALTSGLAVRGGLDSGAAVKSALKYNQNFASNELGNYMNLLAQQQNVGLSATNAIMGVATNATNAIAANNTNAANTTANAALLSGQANANMWGNVANAAGQVGGALYQFGSQPRMPTAQSWAPGTSALGQTANQAAAIDWRAFG